MKKKQKKRTLKSWKRKLERCNKYYLSHHYRYNCNPRKAGRKTINCCGFAFRVLYHYGVIPKECIYAYTKRGRLVGQGAGKIKKLCDYHIVDMGFDEAYKKGVELTMTGLLDIMGKLNVVVYGEVGDAFDPAIHNAVMHIEDESVGENTVVEVFQQGFRLGDKVIRFAMVKVAN